MGFNDTTLALPPELKEELRALKIIPKENFSSVIRRLIDKADKVPKLEKRIKELEEIEKQYKHDIEVMKGL